MDKILLNICSDFFLFRHFSTLSSVYLREILLVNMVFLFS